MSDEAKAQIDAHRADFEALIEVPREAPAAPGDDTRRAVGQMFALIREQGGEFTVGGDGDARLSIGGDVVRIQAWPTSMALADVIHYAKKHIPMPWVVRLDRDAARGVWSDVPLGEQARIRANRPSDVGPGWMFSLCGVDVYEATADPPP